MKAILFDFDGTLADTIPVLTEAVNMTLAELGFPGHQTVKGFINHGARELMRGALPPEKQRDEEFLDKAFALYQQNYRKIYLHNDKLYDGLFEVIKTLRPRAKLGILSNKPDEMTQGLAKRLFPAGMMDAVVGFENGKPGKPDPYLAEKASKMLGVPLCNCLLVGDSDVDVATAKNAGMAFVGAGWGFLGAKALYAAGADRVAATPGNLPAELEDFLQE